VSTSIFDFLKKKYSVTAAAAFLVKQGPQFHLQNRLNER